VNLGRQNQQGSNPNNVQRTVTRIINHPQYDDTTNDNDISLLQLSSAVTFNNYIMPVCLAAPSSSLHSGIESWVTGWGKISSLGVSTCIYILYNQRNRPLVVRRDNAAFTHETLALLFIFVYMAALTVCLLNCMCVSLVSLPAPGALMEVEVPIVGNKQCNCDYGVGEITSNMICAGLRAGGKDSCQVILFTPVLWSDLTPCKGHPPKCFSAYRGTRAVHW